MTYNVFSGALNPSSTQSINQAAIVWMCQLLEFLGTLLHTSDQLLN